MMASPLTRVLLLGLALLGVAAACGNSSLPGRGGTPPLAFEDEWARQRVEAVLALYDFTDRGKEAIQGMRVLHVLGRPGWFGSTGYENWVGIGQARPSSVVHELSHSFWGAFPVEGQPGLSWKAAPGEGVSTGIAALRKDLDAFLGQPPDDYEPLRARLRAIPDLITGGFPGLYHLGESEIVYYTGGNLDLVPPALRKYYAPWLKPGPFRSWDEAARWYLALPREQRRVADAYVGFGAMDLEGYQAQATPSAVPAGKEALVMQEERQRLKDFLDQFDLYFRAIEGRPVAQETQFWRGYLRQMAQLHGRHPEVLAGPDSRARRIREGLDFLTKAGATPPEDRTGFAAERLARDAFLLRFAPALEYRTLAELIHQGGAERERLAGRVREALEPGFRQYLATAWQVLETLKRNPEGAAHAFDRFIGTLRERQRRQTNFILDVFAGVDYWGTRRLLTLASPPTALALVKDGPAFTRFLTEPEALATALGFQGDLPQERLIQLARLFNEHVSAIASVDRPFQDAIYRRVLELARTPGGGPTAALEVFIESGMVVEPFLARFPQEAAGLVARDVATAAEVFREANPVRLPPARAIYRLIQADPAVAARVTLHYDRVGRRDIVLEALAFFAFDSARLLRQPGLGVSLEHNGRFLVELAQRAGDPWLRDALAAMRARIQGGIARGDLPPSFLEAYAETALAGLATLAVGGRDRVAPLLAAALAG